MKRSAAVPARRHSPGRRRSIFPVGRSHASILLTLASVAAFYGFWLNAQRPLDQPERLAEISERFLAKGRGSSAAIDDLEAVAVHGYSGYDGQFFVFMAIDLTHAPSYVDDARYRMNRIGFPVAAVVVSGGSRPLIPWAMLGLELFSVMVTTFLLAVMITARGGSAFLALLYGLSPGLFFSVSHLLSEAPANALAVLGVFLWQRGRDGRPERPMILAAGCAFAAAALTRETTLLFPAGIALWMISTGGGGFWSRARPAALLVSLAVGPVLCWQAFLAWWLPPEGVPTAAHFEWVPFSGLLADGATTAMVGQLLAVVLPSCIAVAVTAAGTRWSVWTPLIALNAAVLIVFLPHFSYSELGALSRISLPVTIVFALAAPEIHGRLRFYGVLVAGTLWMLPWFDWLPRFVT